MKILTENGLRFAVLDDETPILRSEQDALDLIAEMAYTHDAHHLVFPAAALEPAFFDLRSGLAGRVLQKFANHNVRVAVAGDYSVYKSNALRQFIMESNKGRQVYFAASTEEALAKLSS